MLFCFWLCPEEIRIGGRVALPIVVDEAYGYQSDVFLCRIGAIVALWVESTVFFANKVVEVLRHITIQITLFGLLLAVVPVCRIAEHQRQVVDHSLAHFGNAEHCAILVHHPGIIRRINPKPLL